MCVSCFTNISILKNNTRTQSEQSFAQVRAGLWAWLCPCRVCFLIPQAMLIIVIVSGMCVCISVCVCVGARYKWSKVFGQNTAKVAKQALSLSTAAAAAAALLAEWLRVARTHTHVHILHVCLKSLFNSRRTRLLLLFPSPLLASFIAFCRTCETAIFACKFSLFSAILFQLWQPLSLSTGAATHTYNIYGSLRFAFRISQPANCQCAGSGNALLDLAAKCSFRRQVATTTTADCTACHVVAWIFGNNVSHKFPGCV